MDNRCPSCGTRNNAYATKCKKCDNPLDQLLRDQKSSITDIRAFSIVYFITSVIGTASFVYNYITTGKFSYGYFSSVPSINTAQAQAVLTSTLYPLEILAGLSAVITLVSIFFLRSGYGKLRRYDFDFSSPITGTTMIFVGLIMLVVGIIALLAFFIAIIPGLLQNPPVFSSTSIAQLGLVAIVVLIGGILFIIGVILSILLGLHRLAGKFDEGMFEGAWVMYLISLIFQPIGIIAAIMSYAGSNRTIKRLDESSEPV